MAKDSMLGYGMEHLRNLAKLWWSPNPLNLPGTYASSNSFDTLPRSLPLQDITVTWNDYHHKIEQLAVQIHDSGWEFDQIVCLAKGGLRIGDVFARLFNVPLAILSASSYGGADGRQRGKLTFSRDLSMTSINLGSRILLVDDLADSGWTLKRGIDWLQSHYGFYIEEIRAAVLWYKACSVHKPDYFVDFLEDSPWIHQPFEPYELMSPVDLAKKLQQQQ